tara:strand:+ start:1995 stop:2249 length:255 start_codon:yes stop_codon:yes gene_type:complete
MSKTNENPDHTVWTVEVEAISKVFATEAEAQKYIDFTNKKDIFKVKKQNVNPANLYKNYDGVTIDMDYDSFIDNIKDNIKPKQR